MVVTKGPLPVLNVTDMRGLIEIGFQLKHAWDY